MDFFRDIVAEFFGYYDIKMRVFLQYLRCVLGHGSSQFELETLFVLSCLAIAPWAYNLNLMLIFDQVC